MSLILNIETATTVCSVSIAKDGKVLGMKEQNDGYSHSELLAPFMDELLKELNLSANKLDAIAVSEGPGSYTGLRIGVSTAKGLCYSLNIPLIAVSSLQCMALEASEKYKELELFYPMIDARRMEVYTQTFDSNNVSNSAIEAKVLNENSFSQVLASNKIVLCGDGSSKCKDFINSENCIIDDTILPSSKSMANISYQKYVAKDFKDVAYFEPFYLKDFVTGVSKVKGLR